MNNQRKEIFEESVKAVNSNITKVYIFRLEKWIKETHENKSYLSNKRFNLKKESIPGKGVVKKKHPIHKHLDEKEERPDNPIHTYLLVSETNPDLVFVIGDETPFNKKDVERFDDLKEILNKYCHKLALLSSFNNSL